jgi:[protein-PII] uridylyltransferase
VDFADQERAAADPASWFQAFEVALAHGEPVADEALALIERRVGRYAVSDLLPSSGDRQRLFDWLRPARGLYARLSERHECGLLGKLFPGFAAISSRVIRDFYHKYTVDEHTLLTIRSIERLLDASSGRERFAALLGELPSPERLVVALLLHDVGKWKEEDHATESARMARSMLRQLGASEAMTADVLFLVEQHLQMSARALRRDSEDPEVARQLGEIVGTEERLKMLCLLTLADIDAVGPGTLTPWKEELLWRLYVDTYNELTIAYADRVIDGTRAAAAVLHAGRPADLTDADLSRFLEGLPQRYLSVVDQQHVYAHARLAREVHRDAVGLLLEPRGGTWDLAVVTLDKPQLFSNICGVLSYLGMDILRGSAMTSPTGLVLDLFQFADREGFLARNPSACGELEALLQDVVAGRRDATALVRRKALSPLHRGRGLPPVKPVVYFDTDHSEHYTVLEIVAADAPGLLHRVSRIISEHGCSVELVLIATEGSRAIDVFHLTGPGGKLPALARGALKADLERMLEESDDED